MTVSSLQRKWDEYSNKPGKPKKSARSMDEPPGYLGKFLEETQGRVTATILLVLANRGAMFFGMPRTGNAVLIRCWLGGDLFEDYCSSAEECERTLESLRDAAEALMSR
jgi:hypothetical protein